MEIAPIFMMSIKFCSTYKHSAMATWGDPWSDSVKLVRRTHTQTHTSTCTSTHTHTHKHSQPTFKSLEMVLRVYKKWRNIIHEKLPNSVTVTTCDPRTMIFYIPPSSKLTVTYNSGKWSQEHRIQFSLLTAASCELLHLSGRGRIGIFLPPPTDLCFIG
jgi:hypothetical protein